MAESKPISYKDIAEPGLLKPLRVEIEAVNTLLEKTSNALKEVINESAKIAKSTPLDSFENIEKVEKSINDTTQAVKELDKVEKDRIRLQKQLQSLDDERIKDNFQLKEQIRLQTKELRDNAKEANANLNAYQKLTKATNNAQNEYKRLAAEFGANSEQAEEARKEFERLDDQLREINDTARDGRRDVGRYEKGVKGLTRTFKAFAGATIVLKILEVLQTTLASNTDTSDSFQKVIVRLTAAIVVFGRRVTQIIPVVQARLERFFISTRIGILETIDLFGSNEEKIKELDKEYVRLSRTADKDISGAFSNLGDEITDLTRKKIDLIDRTTLYRRQIVGLEKEIADLIPKQEALQAQFDNDSLSIQEQISAGVELQKVLRGRFATEQEIASKRLRLAQLNASANRGNVDAQEEASAALLQYNDLLAQQVAVLAGNERVIQKLRDDATQLNLDFYIDDFDNRKTVNERIIADETQTFKTRRALLEDNLRRTEEIFDLEEQALNKSLSERGKAVLDFDELRKKSSEEIAQIVQESGISEPLAIRVLEVLRERRTFLQDNAEAQRDLNDAQAESLRLQNEVILQEEALTKLQEQGVNLEEVLTELSEKRLQNEIDNLQKQIELTEEGSERFIALNKELNDKLIEQNENALEKYAERVTEIAEATDEAINLLSDIADKRTEKRVEAINKELQAEQKRIDTLQELAAQGNETAENNIALAEQRQAELELKREQQLKRQERRELAFAAVQAYSSKVQANDPNPLASTIADVSVLRAFVNSLPAFYDGTELVSKDLPQTVPGRDGYVIRADGSERILTGAQNSLIGDMTNNELAKLAHDHRANKADRENKALLNEVRELKAITRDKPTYMGTDYDAIADIITRRIQKGKTNETIKQKNKGGIW